MAFVITQNCCKDARCVPACLADSIRPGAGVPDFSHTEMLYIDPQTCIDCGASIEECPVDAIYFEDDLLLPLEPFRDINARYFENRRLEADTTPARSGHGPIEPGSLRVAIVGAGPAGCYAAADLLRVGGVEVDMFERLPTPFGLIRAGVAPDHQRAKSVVDVFDSAFRRPSFGCHHNIDGGRDVSHADLVAHHHAVIYGVRASKSRGLGIPGEQLAGNYAAADFVGWYNGHPDHAEDEVDLSSERTVVIGNGKAAVDIASVLLMSPEDLVITDIARHAPNAVSQYRIREVIILGRRRPADSASSVGEFLALGYLPGIDVTIDSDDLSPDPDHDLETGLKLELARQYAARERTHGNTRSIFRYLASPVEVVGGSHAEGLRVVHPSGDIDEGSALEGLPFDSANGIVPNDNGRVLDDGHTAVGVCVTGWIKRRPRGMIGTNRACAEQTVAQLWRDVDAGLLNCDVSDRTALMETLAKRGANRIDWAGRVAIDEAERELGIPTSRPRAKFVNIAEMLAVAGGDPLPARVDTGDPQMASQ